MRIAFACGSVGEFQHATVLLRYPLNDGQTKPRTLLPGRDIGFDQPVAVFFWQSAAIVDHIDDESILGHAEPDHHASLRFPSFAARVRVQIRVHGFAGVFHEVRNRLGEQAPVAQRHQRLFHRLDFEFDLGPAHLEQNHRFAHDLANILLLEDR